jgi:hypothetical protein
MVVLSSRWGHGSGVRRHRIGGGTRRAAMEHGTATPRSRHVADERGAATVVSTGHSHLSQSQSQSDGGASIPGFPQDFLGFPDL